MMNKSVENILETFIKEEINVTDSRVAAIRLFVDTLKSELLKYTAAMPENHADKEYLAIVLKLFREMIFTYDDEIKLLIQKREKMLEHLLSIRSAISVIGHTGTASTDLHIN